MQSIVQHASVPGGRHAAASARDDQLVNLWLHGRPAHTQRAYAADAERFRACVRTLAAVKSLLSCGQRVGYLPMNVGAAVKLPPRKDTLAERILTEADVHRMLALEPGKRNQVQLRLLYIAGLRVSEIAKLKWRDLQPRTDGGQVTVFGKGSKTRTVLLPSA